MVLTFIISGVAILLGCYYVVKNVFQKYVNYNLPKGPLGLPLLGNILQMLTTHPHLKFTQWAKQYGDLYTIHIGTRPALVVNDAKVLKQLLSLYPATGKFKNESFLAMSQGPYGIFMTVGEHHSEQRTATLQAMKAVGFGGGSAIHKTKIWEEVHETCDAIESTMTDGITTVVIYDYIHQTLSNTLWTVICGEKMEQKVSSEFTVLLRDFVKSFMYSVKTGLLFLPWLRHVAPRLSGYEALNNICIVLHRYIENSFEKEKSTWREDAPPRHAIDCCIEQLKKCQNNSASSFYGEIGMKNSIASLVELFIAGVETTTASLTWVLYYLCFNPSIQKKLQAEIDVVVGRSRNPTLEDRPNMPYTEAVMLEGSRHSSVVSLGPVHELLDDVPNFLGYSLPKGLLIVLNLYGIHHNRKTWGDSQVFRPDRFLSEDVDHVQKLRENVVPFSGGRRICLGEQQAKDFMFLMLTHVLQKFQIKPDPSTAKETYFDANVGMGLMPKLLPIQFILRD